MEDSEASACRAEGVEGLEHDVGGYDRSPLGSMRGNNETSFG